MTNEIDLSREAGKALSIQWLAKKDTDKTEIKTAMESFVDSYEKWIKGQILMAESLGEHEKTVSSRIIDRQKLACSRMRKGVTALFDEGADQSALKAFQISQEAMLYQFLWAMRDDGPRDLGEGNISDIDPWSSSYSAKPAWRPFQLAYQLLVVESLINDESIDREILDLLWFPTGGGKTEAYLALTAFEIARRRLVDDEAGAGTSVIMRYTLRLLTTQQFQRSARLISVLEWMRKKDLDSNQYGLGSMEIKLGLWVGASTTPNRLDNSNESSPGMKQIFEKTLDEENPENPLHLGSCPFCSTRIVPNRKSPTKHYGFYADASGFKDVVP